MSRQKVENTASRFTTLQIGHFYLHHRALSGSRTLLLVLLVERYVLDHGLGRP